MKYHFLLYFFLILLLLYFNTFMSNYQLIMFFLYLKLDYESFCLKNNIFDKKNGPIKNEREIS